MSKAVLSSKFFSLEKYQVRRALLSVFNKQDIVSLAKGLGDEVELLSTGGTRKMLTGEGLKVTEVSDYTSSPELLGGRVKTLHPKIYGGLLARRSDPDHLEDCQQNKVGLIDLVVVNLYPFSTAVGQSHAVWTAGGKRNPEEATGLENIDIGGVSLIRACAKNYYDTVLLTSPAQYSDFLTRLKEDRITPEYRHRLAVEGFKITSQYDKMISEWLENDRRQLKYGLNPHQEDAWILGLEKAGLMVKGGNPGYINFLDALQGYRLVSLIWEVLGVVAACSMKHVSPAGVGLGTGVYPDEVNPFLSGDGVVDDPVSIAYARARNSDPRSSFGDFVCVNSRVTVAFAKKLKSYVCDGLIAPDFEEGALDILTTKKGGRFIILQMPLINNDGADSVRGCENERDSEKERSGETSTERREIVVNGSKIVLQQSGLNIDWNKIKRDIMAQLASTGAEQGEALMNDMVMGMISILYTQSNSVGVAYQGQMIGIGAGQQSRIDCVDLACRKADIFLERQTKEAIEYLASLRGKRQEKLNQLTEWAEESCRKKGEIGKESGRSENRTGNKSGTGTGIFSRIPGLIIISDAFFPFRDNIDHCSEIGVEWVVQPGGSVQDSQVQEACQEYGMTQILTGTRLFWH